MTNKLANQLLSQEADSPVKGDVMWILTPNSHVDVFAPSTSECRLI